MGLNHTIWNVLFWSLFFISTTACANQSKLESYCFERQGRLLSEWTCPNSGEKRESSFCQISDPNGVPMIFNGCTASFGNYGEIFFEACVQHDFCYHHEPQSHGLVKKDCDRRFLAQMIQICDSKSSEKAQCKASSTAFYRAVRLFGEKSWDCSKVEAQYDGFQTVP